MKMIVFLASMTLPGACSHAQTPATTIPMSDARAKQEWESLTSFTEPKLKEISGLAPSISTQSRLWSHNDSGGDAELHALDLDGTFLGSVAILGVKNEDWEDLCAFQLGKQSYLLIADTGDNARKRLSVQCHIVIEPKTNTTAIDVAWTQTIRYQDGPQDCESVAVYEDKIFLLNKDKGISVIYQAPLGGPKQLAAPVTAKKLAVLPHVKSAASSLTSVLKSGLLGTQATALDISPDGQWAASLTYTDMRLFKRQGKESWRTTFARSPKVIALPDIYQPEALCFSADGKSLLVSSEESPTPIVRYQLPTK